MITLIVEPHVHSDYLTMQMFYDYVFGFAAFIITEGIVMWIYLANRRNSIDQRQGEFEKKLQLDIQVAHDKSTEAMSMTLRLREDNKIMIDNFMSFNSKEHKGITDNIKEISVNAHQTNELLGELLSDFKEHVGYHRGLEGTLEKPKRK